MYVFCTDLNRHNHYTQQLQTTSQAAISHNKKWKLSEEYIDNIDKVETWLKSGALSLVGIVEAWLSLVESIRDRWHPCTERI